MFLNFNLTELKISLIKSKQLFVIRRIDKTLIPFQKKEQMFYKIEVTQNWKIPTTTFIIKNLLKKYWALNCGQSIEHLDSQLGGFLCGSEAFN